MRHLDDGTLQEWLDRERSGMGPERAEAVDRHVRDCEACAARVAEMDSLSQTTATLLSAAQAHSTVTDYGDVLTLADRRRRPIRIRRPAPLAWAATVTLALGAGWLTNELARSDRVPATPLDRDAPSTAPADVRTEAPAAVGARTPLETDGREPVAEAPATVTAFAGPVAPARTASAEPSAITTDRGGSPASPVASVLLQEPTPAALPATTARPDATALVDASTVAPVDAPGGAAEASPPAAPMLDAPTRTAEASVTPRYLTGRVTDADGNPLAAAQVYLPGAGLGALTRSDGTYLLALGGLRLDPTDVLRVDLIGYASEAQPLGPTGGEAISTDFTLRQQALTLEAIVVTGTASSAERRSVGNSVATLTVAGGEAARAALEAAGWRRSNRVDAETRAGFSLLLIPEAPVTSVHVLPSNERWVVRVVQRLASGVEVILVQARGAPAYVAGAGVDGWAVATALRGEITVTGTAALPLDSLHLLLDQVR